MKKTALITGISGMDGSHLADFLLEKGYEVFGMERRSSYINNVNTAHLEGKITILNGDMTDQNSLLRCLKESKPDEVYNLAAQSFVGESWNTPEQTSNVTGLGVLRILEAIREFNPDIKFYQASSSEMFGRMVENPANENTPFYPRSPYGVSKLYGHWITKNYRESYDMFACSGILFNHESERRGEHFVTRKITKWIGEFMGWLDRSGLDESQLTRTKESDELIYASGHQDSYRKLRLGNLKAKRDWGHAEDYVEAMWLMLQQDEPDDYVVATGETYSVADFLDASFRAVGIEDWSNLVYIDPEFYRPAEVDYLLGIPTKAEDKLGWERKISFSDLAERMVKFDVEETRLQRSGLQAV